jgi:hypothetical protein
MLRLVLRVVFLHFYFKACVRKWIWYFYSVSRQKTDFLLYHLFLSVFLSFFNVLSFPHFDFLVWHSIQLLVIFFSSLEYRTVICLRLARVGNDLAKNFPWEPLDGRCLHKFSWEIIVTCCLAPMLEKSGTHESFLIHHCLLSFVHLLAHFCFFNFILSCQLSWLWPTEQWNELNTDV